MSKAASSPILQMIRRALEGQRVRQLSDQALLKEFTEQGDQAAFQALLYRHGAMVLNVCRNVLGCEADAEDAFQATWVILARKAASIRKTASVGSWLHGVAHRTALKARARALAREKKEARTPGRPASDPDDLAWREVRQVLHEELTGLAERYRAPLVACYLEGKTQEEAAAQLGMAKSTLKERLERGRSLLRARLVRRGLGPAALLTAAAWPDAASASVPVTLVSNTVKAATLMARGQAGLAVLAPNVAALMEGALKTVFLTKLKLATVVLLGTALVAAGAGITMLPAQCADGGAGPRLETPAEREDRPGPSKVRSESLPLPAVSGPEAEPERRETPPRGRTPIQEAGQDSDVPPPPVHKGHHARKPGGMDGEFGHHPDGHHHRPHPPGDP